MLPPNVLADLTEALKSDTTDVIDDRKALVGQLLSAASQGRLEQQELRRVAVAMRRANDYPGMLDLIERSLREHPEWISSASIRQLRGDALIGLARRFRTNALRSRSQATRELAWREFFAHLDQAEHELQEALAQSAEPSLSKQIQTNLDYLNGLRRDNPPAKRT